MLSVYEHNMNEAEQRGELDFWLASSLENTSCCTALEKLAANGGDLTSAQGAKILEEYGIDRVAWVLTLQIRMQDHAPEWTKDFVPPAYPQEDAKGQEIHAPMEQLMRLAGQVKMLYDGYEMLDHSQCAEPFEGQDVNGRLLIISPKALKDEFKKAYNQYFYATGINEYGRISGYFLADGMKAAYRPERILGVADTEQLPQWAAERLAQIHAPQMQVRIFQIDHEKDPNRLAFEGSEMLPEGKVDASMYRQVYGGTVNCSSLEELFSLCNDDHKPPGYYGESMSVSNVIEVCEGEQKGFYYCDKVGFKPIDFDISQTDHQEMLRILICEPDKEAYPAEIQDCLEAKQAVVGGLVEAVYFDRDGEVFAYCNEEGLLEHLPLNRKLGSEMIVGTLMIAGDQYTPDGYVERSLTDEQIAKWGAELHYPLISLSQEEAAMYHITEPETVEELVPVQA